MEYSTGIALVPLSQGLFAVVDDADAEFVKRWRWYAHKTKSGFYAVRNGRASEGKLRQLVYLHRELAGAGSDVEVDHENGKKLDCRRQNIRIATSGQNKWNRGPAKKNALGLKGVSETVHGKFHARICLGYKTTHLGNFDTAEAAAMAYDDAAKSMHGDFARLNFPERNR